MRQLGPLELRNYLAQTDQPPLLLDVREPWEFDTCHIAGSHLLPMGQITQEIDQLDPQREIVVICHHGIRSRHVAYYLEQNGFTNVINLEGGVERWAVEIDPGMKRY
jgi:rhodanese-related sulfurtransferase